MSREILFRAKRIDNGAWVEGYLVASHISVYILPTGRYLWELSPALNCIAVDHATVGQYTGRTAQCKDKIFDGDRCIVTTFDHEGADYQHECVVVWDSGCLAFSNENAEFWLPVACVEDTDSDVEVIGNIYDNPELLEVGK